MGARPGGDRARRPRASAPLAGLPRRRDRRQGGRGPLPDARRAAAADHVRRLADRRGRLRRLHEPPGRDVLGYSLDEWRSEPDFFSRHLHPDDRDRVLEAQRAARASGEPLLQEYRFIAKGGRTVWLQDSFTIVRDEAGRPAVQPGLRARRDRPEARRAGPGAAPSARAGAERAAAQARPDEGRVHRARLARAANAADLDPRLPRADARRPRRRRGHRGAAARLPPGDRPQLRPAPAPRRGPAARRAGGGRNAPSGENARSTSGSSSPTASRPARRSRRPARSSSAARSTVRLRSPATSAASARSSTTSSRTR